MKKILIARINGSEIFAETSEDGTVLVPIKPICTAIGVDFKAQHTKIQEDEILSSVITLRVTTGADGKQYEMVCLPLKYIYGWLFTINPKNVAPEIKESVIKYRKECYEVLYDHFTGRMKKTNELNQEEIRILNELRKALEQKKELTSTIKNLEKSLDDLRSDRLDPNPSLFD